MKKRGQVTLFIILGIALLVIVGSIFFLREIVFKDQLARLREKAGIVPEQIKPVKNLLDNCAEEVAFDGIQLLGLQGGYIDIPNDIIPRSTVNPFSNSLEVFPGSTLKVAYWFYETANGIQKNTIPTISEMEAELNNYVDENYNTCLENLTAYEDIGYSLEFLDNVNTETKIRDNSVEVTVNYPVNVELKDVSAKLNNHFADVDVELGKFYKTAKSIQEKENEDNFLEDKTLDILAVYDEIPFSGTKFTCEQQIWSKSKAIQDFKEVASNNIQALKVKESNYVLRNKYNKYFVINVPGRNLNVNFLYSPDWPFVAEIEPSNGDILRSEVTGDNVAGAAKLLSRLFCISNYQFIYDVKYPVLVTLADESSLNKGFLFQFSTQVIIDNNQPRENILGTESLTEIPTLCKNAITPTTVVALTQQNGRVVAVDDALISLKCIATTCDIGKTSSDSTGDYSLTADFPQCINAFITAEKPGYFSPGVIASTNEPSQITVPLLKVYELDVDVKVIENGVVRDLRSDEEVSLEFNSLDTDFGSSAVTSAIFPKEDIEETKLNLISSKYNVKSYVFSKPGFNAKIEETTIESCTRVPKPSLLGLFFSEEKCVDTVIPETSLELVVKGGAEFEFEFTENALKNSNKLTLYTVVNKEPKNYEELNQIYDNIQLNAQSEDFIFPKLS